MVLKREQGSESAAVERCIVVYPDVAKSQPSTRSVEEIVQEGVGLAEAIQLEVLFAGAYKVARLSPGYLFGKGHRDTIAEIVADLKPQVVIVNCALSPVQQRNLEKSWKAKVIDRTGLILEIFGARAHTREGRLQVEMAALEYQRSRLVRAWTHLERQRGGAGFMGGPGERQIELDRRIISDKITRLKREIEDVRRTREIGRKARERVPFPVVALVGYTNAGKSTLFNILTNENILAQDMLFATLDPTLRKITLPNEQDVILSDTVGFISDLPTHLVAAFSATLEQTKHAHAILHVIDVSRGDYEAQRQDVIKILKDMGIAYEDDERILEVYNKIDQAAPEIVSELRRAGRNDSRIVLISALQEQGLSQLLTHVAAVTARMRQNAVYELAWEEGKAMSWLYEHAEVLTRAESEAGARLEVLIDAAEAAKFERYYGIKALES